jgi:hypothetical protein
MWLKRDRTLTTRQFDRADGEIQLEAGTPSDLPSDLPSGLPSGLPPLQRR